VERTLDREDRSEDFLERRERGQLSGVNYFFALTTIISPCRVNSSLLLPSATRCLTKDVTRPKERGGWQIEEAMERDNEAGTD
jgi:hypothetical protein